MRCSVNNQHASSLKNTSNQLHGMLCIKVQRKKLGISAEANEYGLSSITGLVLPFKRARKKAKTVLKILREYRQVAQKSLH